MLTATLAYHGRPPVPQGHSAEAQPDPQRGGIPFAPSRSGLLPLDRRVMSWWPRWKQMRPEAREWQARMWGSDPTAQSLARFAANLERVRPRLEYPLPSGVVPELLDGLALQPQAIPDVVRAATGMDGLAARELEKALAAHAEGREVKKRSGRPAKENDKMATIKARILAELERRGIDLDATVPTPQLTLGDRKR